MTIGKTEVTRRRSSPLTCENSTPGFGSRFISACCFLLPVDAGFHRHRNLLWTGALAPCAGTTMRSLRCSTAWKRTSHRGIRPKPSSTESAAPFWMCKASGQHRHRVFIRLPCRRVAEKRPAMAFAPDRCRANCMSRVIYAAPYTSIIDQNADTFEKIFGTENVIEHHSSAEYLFPKARTPRYRKMLAAENWDAPSSPRPLQLFESLFARANPPAAASCTTSPTACSS